MYNYSQNIQRVLPITSLSAPPTADELNDELAAGAAPTGRIGPFPVCAFLAGIFPSSGALAAERRA